MKNLIILIVFLVSGILIANAQEVNLAANVAVENLMDEGAAIGNAQEDVFENVSDEGYGVDDQEYYGSEGNVEMDDALMDEQILDNMEIDVPEVLTNAVEVNETK